MFNVRPALPRIGFNVDPGQSVPGFRVVDNGPARGYDSAPGEPQSVIPVRWTSDPTSRPVSGSALSFWDDVWDTAKGVGERANAVVNGAYSIFPGTGNFFRAAGRGLGLHGPEESHRFRQEMRAAGEGLKYIAEDPMRAARLAYEGGSAAFGAQPLLPYYVGGRAGMGALLAFGRLPIAPLAIIGDAFHAIEKGHNVIDAGVYGVTGGLPRAR